MEIPASFIFKTENADLFNQMREMTLEKLEEFEKRRKYGLEKSLKKKETKNCLFYFSSNLARLYKIFPLIISSIKRFKVQSNLYPHIISSTAHTSKIFSVVLIREITVILQFQT